MLTAPFIAGGIEVNLPHTRTSAKASVEGVVITLDKQRRVYVGEDHIPLAQLTEILREIHGGDELRPRSWLVVPAADLTETRVLHVP